MSIPFSYTELLVIAPQIRSGELSDTEIAARSAVFPAWAAGVDVKAGALLRWDGTVVEVVQAHTTQADWTPDKVPALWTPVRETKSTTPDPFVQPTGAADAYSVGDRVTFQGAVWESTMDANVWSPTAYPAGWKKAG